MVKPYLTYPRTKNVLFLLVALPLFFSIGRYIPVTRWTLEVGILLAAAWATFASISGPPRLRSSFNFYIFVVAFGLPVLGAFGAYIVFDQPILYGLAAQRGCLLALIAFAAGRTIAHGKFALADFRNAFIVLAWLNLAICAPVLIFLDPNNYSDLGALVSDGGGVYNQFQLPIAFIVFGAMYYVSRWAIHTRLQDAVTALPFVLYLLIGNSGRILSIALIASIMMIVWFGSAKNRARNLTIIVALVISAFLVLSLLNPDGIVASFIQYKDAFAAISGSYGVDDVSANARIIQTEIALPYIIGSPMFGTGVISNEWGGGYRQMFGYFHPSDLGLVGLAFTYGAIGILFFALQYLFFARLMPHISGVVAISRDRCFFLAMVANLGFILFSSVFSGVFLLVPEQSLLFFAIVIAHVHQVYTESIPT